MPYPCNASARCFDALLLLNMTGNFAFAAEYLNIIRSMARRIRKMPLIDLYGDFLIKNTRTKKRKPLNRSG